MLEIFIAAIAALPPILLWMVEKPVLIHFAGRVRILTSFGQLSGLVGLALFVVVIFFSTRPKFIEKRFGGLDKIYKYHHLLGIVSFVLILIHPATLALAKLRPTFSNFFHYFYFSGFLPQDLGVVALWLMVILLSLTLFFRPAYKIWKITHKFLGLALLLGVVHSFFVGSDISYYWPLKVYMLILVSIGIAAAIYQIILSPFVRKKYPYEVIKVNTVSDDIFEIILAPKGEKLMYEAGQFVFIKFSGGDVPLESHPFSLASGAKGANLRIVVKKSGDYTGRLGVLKKNTKCFVEGPYGGFTLSVAKNKKQIWLAGGIGIAPFLGMINDVTGENVDFYYCAKNIYEAPFLSEVQALASTKTNIRVITYFSDGRKHINADIIKKTSGDFQDKDFYICGPEELIKDLTNEIVKEGVNITRIHSELFNY